MDYNNLLASDGSGDAALMHVTADRSIGATTIEVDVVTGVPAFFIGTYGTLGSDGFITAASKVDFYGHLDTDHLVIDGFCPGFSDAGTASGQVVVIKPNTSWANLVASYVKQFANEVAVDGWLNDTNEVPTYYSVDDTNRTGVLSVTDASHYDVKNRIKFTQGAAVVHGIITVTDKVNNRITYLRDSDSAALTTGAITNFYYSRQDSPAGFPLDPAKWTVVVNSTTDRNVITTANTFSSLTDAITVPIGAWRLMYDVTLNFSTSNTTDFYVALTLSSDATTETNPKLTALGRHTAPSTGADRKGWPIHREETIDVASATTFTLLGISSGVISLGTIAASHITGIAAGASNYRAVCAYL